MAPRPSTSALTKLSASVGIMLAMVLAVLVNVLVSRHYRRWDVSEGGLFTLSDATLQTLHSLEEPVTVYVLLGPGDPQAITVDQLLQAYGAETTRLEVKLTDPDRHPAEFLAIQQRYNVVPGRTDDGRIVTDASIIVVRGDRPYFLTPRDLVEVEDEDDTRARPRLEQALTSAIRAVTSGEPPKVCFTIGHGEHSIDDGGPAGLSDLRERLTKNNYAAASVEPVHDTAEKDPYKGCSVLVLAGPTERLPDGDARAMRAFLEAGGSALLAVGPQPDEHEKGYLDLGVSDLLAYAGVRIRSDFVFERDPEQRSAQGFGETFVPLLKPHAITDGLIHAFERDKGLAVVLTIGSSLERTGAGVAAPSVLLETTPDAFGMVDFMGWAKNPSEPAAGEADHKGPLVVAYASELPAPNGSSAPRGSRVVVVGSTSPLAGANWQNQELRGTALFIESAMSWLAARPANLDIPSKPAFTAGLRLSEDDLGGVFRYVVLYMPLAAALLGVAVYLRRRGTERRGARPDKRGAGPEKRGDGPEKKAG